MTLIYVMIEGGKGVSGAQVIYPPFAPPLCPHLTQGDGVHKKQVVILPAEARGVASAFLQ